MRQMIYPKTNDDRIEHGVVEREMLGIALTKFDVGKRRSCQLNLSYGKIETDRMSAALYSRRGGVAGACRHVKNPGSTCHTGGVEHGLR
jgi:hypothetical protein